MPQSYHTKGAATFNSLLYVIALMEAAELCDFMERKDTATEYCGRAQALRASINKHCFEDGLYLDGPSSKKYSQHCQVFAVLSETVTGTSARELMVRITIRLWFSALAPCNFTYFGQWRKRAFTIRCFLRYWIPGDGCSRT